MESFRLVRTFYHYLAEIGSLHKTYGSRERVGPPLTGTGAITTPLSDTHQELTSMPSALIIMRIPKTCVAILCLLSLVFLPMHKAL